MRHGPDSEAAESTHVDLVWTVIFVRRTTGFALHTRSRLSTDTDTLSNGEFLDAVADLDHFADNFMASNAEITRKWTPATCDETVNIVQRIKGSRDVPEMVWWSLPQTPITIIKIQHLSSKSVDFGTHRSIRPRLSHQRVLLS